jgi:hypothetical protein
MPVFPDSAYSPPPILDVTMVIAEIADHLVVFTGVKK